MIECEYTTKWKGYRLSVYYDNRNTGWGVWLEAHGTMGWGINAEDALASANAKLGTTITLADLVYVDHCTGDVR